jgi:hypothetical protein
MSKARKKTVQVGGRIIFNGMIGQVVDICPDGKVEVEFRLLHTFDLEEVEVEREFGRSHMRPSSEAIANKVVVLLPRKDGMVVP